MTEPSFKVVHDEDVMRLVDRVIKVWSYGRSTPKRQSFRQSQQ